MNNEKKAPVLTLEHLAPYIPYGVELLHISHFNGNRVMKKWGIRNCSDYPVIEYCDKITFGRFLSEVKPILRPISDLTKEIEHNGERFVPRSRIDQYNQKGGDGKLYLLVDGGHWSCNPLSWYYSTVLKLISWHFDVFGLLDQNLAIDINSIEGKEKGNG